MARGDTHDLILVGTGFASSFFLYRFLETAPADARVVVLERGTRHTHAEYLGRTGALRKAARASIVNESGKLFNFLNAFGGGSNCWWANTPRMLPADFELQSRFGVGRDWPIGYDALEPWYSRAEELMAIAGCDSGLFPRSRPYPLPAHTFSQPDVLFREAYPDAFFCMPSGRASRPVRERAACCSQGVCSRCPIDAKFTIANGMNAIYADPRVRLELGAEVVAVELAGGRAQGVRIRQDGAERVERGELVGLGANGIFNPFLLQRSGLEHPELGRGLTEQVSAFIRVELAGVDNFQGSTSRCGAGYMLHGDEGRERRAAGLLLTHNTRDATGLRLERGRWREVLGLTAVFEDLRHPDNRVVASPSDPDKPEIQFAGRSAYAERAIAALPSAIEEVLAPLPVEGFEVQGTNPTESHLIGSTVMGSDPATSVIDADLVHHEVRNLVVLGSGAFPTAAPANPTLTLSALSLRSAERLFGSRA